MTFCLILKAPFLNWATAASTGGELSVRGRRYLALLTRLSPPSTLFDTLRTVWGIPNKQHWAPLDFLFVVVVVGHRQAGGWQLNGHIRPVHRLPSRQNQMQKKKVALFELEEEPQSNKALAVAAFQRIFLASVEVLPFVPLTSSQYHSISIHKNIL
jgi:hypothetical protein